MNKRTLIIIAGIIGVVAILAVGWYLGSPLLISNTVDEAFPFEAPDEAAIAAMPEVEREALEKEFMAAVPDTETVEALSQAEREAVEEKVINGAPLAVFVAALGGERFNHIPGCVFYTMHQ